MFCPFEQGVRTAHLFFHRAAPIGEKIFGMIVPSFPMHPRQLIEENLALIERLVGRACRRVGMPPSDWSDTASMVKLELVENDYAILRRWEGRSSLATYLTVVIQRLLADQHEKTHGRRRPSMTQPPPPRMREVELPDEEVVPLAASELADTETYEGELRVVSERAGAIVREAMAAWPADDRLMIRLRFESSLSIADISRLMKVPQRPLYRRLESLLARLRDVLLAAGVDPVTANDLIGTAGRIELDFGLARKNSGAFRTTGVTGGASQQEAQ